MFPWRFRGGEGSYMLTWRLRRLRGGEGGFYMFSSRLRGGGGSQRLRGGGGSQRLRGGGGVLLVEG